MHSQFEILTEICLIEALQGYSLDENQRETRIQKLREIGNFAQTDKTLYFLLFILDR